jgi:hypothetical protein
VDGGIGSQALLRLYSAQGKTILEKRMKKDGYFSSKVKHYFKNSRRRINGKIIIKGASDQ